jgi:hypothetical protein
MAVTVISAPGQGAFTGSYSASYPLLITLSSDKVGDPGIDQHKFKLTLQVNAVPIGYKNFVVTIGIQATSDISDVVREYIQLATTVIHSVVGSRPVPGLNTVGAGQFEGQPVQPPQQVEVTVIPGETYYDAGSFVENFAASFDVLCYRGFSDVDDGETPPTGMKWQYANFYDQYVQANPNTAPGTVFRMSWPFSGYSYQCYPANALRLVQLQGVALQFLIFRVYHVYGGGFPVFAYQDVHDILNLALVQKSLTIYLPIFFYGSTNRQDFEYVQIRMYASSDGIALTTLLDYAELARGVSVCTRPDVDTTGKAIPTKMISLMYKDRFFRWSFFDMPLKSYRSINKTSSLFESQITGRQDYNTKGIETFRVNSELMPESQNKWIEDLFMSEEIYMIGNTGLETTDWVTPDDPTQMIRVRVSELDWSERTTRNEKLIQYTFNLQKSLDLFVP